jgi:hypothetical protein
LHISNLISKVVKKECIMSQLIGEAVELTDVLDQEEVLEAYKLAVAAEMAAALAQKALERSIAHQSTRLRAQIGRRALFYTSELWTQSRAIGGRGIPEFHVDLGRVEMLKVEGKMADIRLLSTDKLLGANRKEWHADKEPCLVVLPMETGSDWAQKAIPLRHGEITQATYIN